MHKFLLLFLLVLASCSHGYDSGVDYGYGGSSCCTEWVGNSEQEDGYIADEYINEPEVVFAVQKVLAYLRYVKHLRLEDAGVCYNPALHLISLEFTSQDVLEVKEARYIIVDLAQAMLAEFNTNPALASTFVQYPLTPLQLEVYIDFESFEGLYVDPFYVGYLTLLNGEVIFYASDNKLFGPDRLSETNVWNLRTEAFETSLSVVIFERESEKLFQEQLELAHPDHLQKEQYRSPDKSIPRYYSPYADKNPVFK